VTDVASENSLEAIVDRHGRNFQTVGAMVYEVLRESILRGVLAPGERLRQDRLAETIGVSRIPVRSALMQLESEGLITFHPYRGAVVTDLSVDEMREIYEIRALLEGYALRKVAPTLTPERLDMLEEMARELQGIDDGEAYLQRRTEFFRALYDAERHPRLVALIEKLLVETGRYWLQHGVEYVRGPGRRVHARILARVREGDVDGAVRLVEERLEALCAELVRRMEADQPPA
jgi:DNA-binding GntR family transcriptional regulator